jgi:hypothetical protein
MLVLSAFENPRSRSWNAPAMPPGDSECCPLRSEMSAQLTSPLSRRKIPRVPWYVPAASTTSSPPRNAFAARDDPSALSDSGSSARAAAKINRMIHLFLSTPLRLHAPRQIHFGFGADSLFADVEKFTRSSGRGNPLFGLGVARAPTRVFRCLPPQSSRDLATRRRWRFPNGSAKPLLARPVHGNRNRHVNGFARVLR